MKVFVVGLSKSGTSVLAYRIAAALPPPTIVEFEPSNFGRKVGDDENLHNSIALRTENLVCKCLMTPKSGEDLDLMLRCSSVYDKKIFIPRDPRDREISLLLYRFYWSQAPEEGAKRERFLKTYQNVLNLVEKKEQVPSSVSFAELHRNGFGSNYFESLYSNMTDLVSRLDSSWCIFSYESMIDGNYQKLSEYLGYNVSSEQQVPDNFSRVVRSKRKENWRDWFLPDDENHFKPYFKNYMQAVGYDPTDWRVNPRPQLDPKEGSQYLRRLHEDRTT